MGYHNILFQTVELYKGGGNLLTVTRKYATEFTCDFNLVLYPFDDQYCDMLLKITSASKDYLIFDNKTSTVSYLGNPLLLEYEVN